MQDKLITISETLGKTALVHKARIVTVESCTGGLLASLITEIPGSSAWFDRGLVTYTADSKIQLADVPQETIEMFGVVSNEVAEAMARGALGNTPLASISLAVTGYAGPAGGEPGCPVGTVCIAWGERLIDGGILTTSKKIYVRGERRFVRQKACELLMRGAVAILNLQNPLDVVLEETYS